MMTNKTKFAVALAILLWASAFVGIRAGLSEYSPEGLALFRYLVASVCMSIFYFSSSKRSKMRLLDIVGLMLIGVIGIGIYNITLNYGELSISSGIASFVISQAPIITAVVAILFFGERLNFPSIIGFMICICGIALIALGEQGTFKWDGGLFYIVIATLSGGCYSALQKPFLKKYNAIEATTYIIWGATLFLLIYFPQFQHDITHASLKSTAIVFYLGVFPAAIAYIAWSYVLAEIPASQAGSFLYFTPFIATLLGWIWLDEMPVWLSLLGGLVAIGGVWVVHQSSVLGKRLRWNE